MQKGNSNYLVWIGMSGSMLLFTPLVIYAQAKPISADDFRTIRLKAESVLELSPSVQFSVEDKFDDKSGSVLQTATRNKEFLPPDKERIKAEIIKDGNSEILYAIRIGKTQYTRREAGAWQTMDEEPEFGGPIPGATSTSKYLYLGLDNIAGISVKAYSVKSSYQYGSGLNETIVQTESTFWIDKQGRYLKSSIESYSNKSGRLRTITTYSYPSSLDIVAPIP